MDGNARVAVEEHLPGATQAGIIIEVDVLQIISEIFINCYQQRLRIQMALFTVNQECQLRHAAIRHGYLSVNVAVLRLQRDRFHGQSRRQIQRDDKIQFLRAIIMVEDIFRVDMAGHRQRPW